MSYLLDYLEGKEGLITLGKDEGSAPALFHYGDQADRGHHADECPVGRRGEAGGKTGIRRNGDGVWGNNGDLEQKRKSRWSEKESPEKETETQEPNGRQPELNQPAAGLEPAGVAAGKTATETASEPETTKPAAKRRGRRKKV